MTEIAWTPSTRVCDHRGPPVAVGNIPVTELSARISAELHAFVSAREAESAVNVARLFEVARDFIVGGKYLRSCFAYLGWLSNADDSPAAVRAAASLELLHSFALIQDDVMDGSAQRRGRPAVHKTLAAHHASAGNGDHDKFGESGATLLADLFLVWSEQMLRTSGLGAEDLQRGWDGFDQMRQELAIGQYLDLLSDDTDQPNLEHTLQVARLKSARYTVTRPLLLGAHLAGSGPSVCETLSTYGDAIGEAFQMRDDILGVFGDPEVTGKPRGDDLQQGKTTTLLALASDLADGDQREQLRGLRSSPSPDATTIDDLRALITSTGAAARLENLMTDRLDAAARALENSAVPLRVTEALRTMAHQCVYRDR